ncbi:MAG: hypothetical protein Hyperionvirus16_51 [Hyperionvirus sp.]|uniref:Uncharacterized protein n=1 Tax=Hyperionvirus sp. TaxID=2487770 RepID=A0A3G5A9Y3_9VIRU|nr:MAG: hypothetical protein Hyperionvirus16_51 [Hyperionvirus sp.]
MWFRCRHDRFWRYAGESANIEVGESMVNFLRCVMCARVLKPMCSRVSIFSSRFIRVVHLIISFARSAGL